MRAYKRLNGFFQTNRYYIFSIMNLIFSITLFRHAYKLQHLFHHVVDIASFLTWHNLFELIDIVVLVSVFVVSYYTYDQARNFKTLFLGSVFLTVGILTLLHTLSYKGMVDFLVSNTGSNRATTFWMLSSMVNGLGILIFCFIPEKRQLKIKKEIFLVGPFLLGIAILILVTYYPSVLPEMYVENVGLTPIKIALEWIIILMLFIPSICMQIRKYTKTGDPLVILFVNALILRSFSELAFTAYGSVYDIYNYLGHVYKLIASFLIFRVIFIYNIQKPYYDLSVARSEIGSWAQKLDKLVNQRTRQLNQMNQKLLDDLKYAREIQQALLPDSLPKEQEVCFEACYFPAESVSGDFYNIIKLDDQHIALYIGDVSGHGVSAAMLTVFINQTITLVRESEDNHIEILRPSKVMRNVYKTFNQTNFKDDVYFVMFYAIYNFKTGKLDYVSGGLNVVPIILRASGEIKEIAVHGGFPICKFANFYVPDYVDESMQLTAGDRILLYTDGLTEAKNKDGKHFSSEQLKKLMRKNHLLPLESLAEIITGEVLGFIDTKELKDDITFFIMQVN